MSGGVTTAIANKIVDHTNGVSAFTEPTTPLKVKLYTTTGTAASAGTEVTGGSYAAQSVTMGSSSAGVASNTGAVVFNGMPACTVTGVEIYDSAGTPVRLWWGPLAASKTLNSGDTFQFDIAALSVSVV